MAYHFFQLCGLKYNSVKFCVAPWKGMWKPPRSGPSPVAARRAYWRPQQEMHKHTSKNARGDEHVSYLQGFLTLAPLNYLLVLFALVNPFTAGLIPWRRLGFFHKRKCSYFTVIPDEYLSWLQNPFLSALLKCPTFFWPLCFWIRNLQSFELLSL